MKWTIQIVEDTNGLNCELRGYDSKVFNISFVLGDFLAIRKSVVDHKTGQQKIVLEYNNHIFTETSENLRDTFYKEIDEDMERAFLCIDKYLGLQESKKSRMGYNSLIEFEELKQRLRIKYVCEISKRGNSFLDGAITSYGANIDSLSDMANSMCWFTYTCFSITDMVAAILHYYMLRGYSLSNCKHCHMMFARKNRKEKYCKRISPYRDIYSQKESKPDYCENTVRHALQQFKLKSERILKKMKQSISVQLHEAPFFAEYSDFLVKCEEYVTQIKAKPTIKNLLAYNEYLENIENSWKGGRL